MEGLFIKKTTVLIISVCVCLVVAIIGITVIATGNSPFAKAGSLRKKLTADISSGDTEIAAIYKDHTINCSQVEYYKGMAEIGLLNNGKASGKQPSDREIIDSIIEGIVLLEEAERRGIEVTDSDVDAMVSNTRMAYNMPEGKAMIDAYCEGAGISVDEYFDIITEQMPRTIARQRVRDDIGREYCEQAGIEFTKKNPPAGMEQAVSDYIDDLMENARKDTEYYVD